MNPGSILLDLYRVNNFDLVKTKKFLYERTLASLNVLGEYEDVELYTSFTDAFRTIVNEARVKKPPNKSVYDHFYFIYNHPKWTKEYTFLLLLHLKVVDIELTVVTEDPKQRVKNIEEAISTMQQLYREKKWGEIANSCIMSLLIIMGTGKLFSPDQNLEIATNFKNRRRSKSPVVRKSDDRGVLSKETNEPNWLDMLDSVNKKARLNQNMNDLEEFYLEHAVQTFQKYKRTGGKAPIDLPVGAPVPAGHTLIPNSRSFEYIPFDEMEYELPAHSPWRLASILSHLSNFIMMLVTYVFQHGRRYKLAAGALQGLFLHNMLTFRLEFGYLFSHVVYMTAMFPTYVEMFYTQNATQSSDLGFDYWERRPYSFMGLIEFPYRDTTDRFTEVPSIHQTWLMTAGVAFGGSVVSVWRSFLASVEKDVKDVVLIDNIYRAERENSKVTKFTFEYLAGLGTDESATPTAEQIDRFDEYKTAARLYFAYKKVGSDELAENIRVAYKDLFRHPKYGVADPYVMFIQILLPIIVMGFSVAYVSLSTQPPPKDIPFTDDPNLYNAPFNTTMNDNVRFMYNACIWIHDYVQNVTKEAGSAIATSGLKITCNLKGIREAIDEAKAMNRMDELEKQRDALIKALAGCTVAEHQKEGNHLLDETNKILNPPVLRSVVKATSSAYTNTANTVKRVVRNDYTQLFFQCVLLGMITLFPALYSSIYGFKTNGARLNYFLFGKDVNGTLLTKEERLMAGTVVSAGLEYLRLDLGRKDLAPIIAYFLLSVGVVAYLFQASSPGADSTFMENVQRIRTLAPGLDGLMHTKWGRDFQLTMDLMLRSRMVFHWAFENVRIYRVNSFEYANRRTFVRTKDYKHFGLKKLFKR